MVGYRIRSSDRRGAFNGATTPPPFFGPLTASSSISLRWTTNMAFRSWLRRVRSTSRGKDESLRDTFVSLMVRVLLIGFVATLGCGKSGPAVGQVSGKVTYKGAPITEGMVSFYSAGANYGADARLDKEGRFEF